MVQHSLTLDALSRQVQRLWELDEVECERISSPENDLCETLFRETHIRNLSGRFSVRLTIRPGSLSSLGESRHIALKQFLSLEKRLNQGPELKSKYVAFLNDYLEQNHMELAPPRLPESSTFYIPHHPVVKKSDPTGKIRVVFNASSKTSTGVSLNDCLISGPKLQSELWLVLTLWRMLKFVFSADIIQMFRQIELDKADRELSRILWRPDSSLPLLEYRLSTVTYGTASAPYLTIRSLKQLAEDEEFQYPLGAIALRRHTFVDDIYFGAQTLQEAIAAKEQLIALLLSGGFRLKEQRSECVFFDPACTSTLGVRWSAGTDSFSLRVAPVCLTDQATKRSVLSDVAKFFDPLGWASPVLIFGKIFLQKLWAHKLKWDEPLPAQLNSLWSEFASNLGELDQITLPRYLHYSSENCQTELLGFSDASELVYAAAVYMRCTIGDSIITNLIVAKTRVVPLKPLSIPRLELCTAVLVAKLVRSVATGLALDSITKFYWTDASVVLCWLKSHPSRWKPYVAHRVALIQEIAPADRWLHVNTHENPADLSTRGISPDELRRSRLCWHGPLWLSQPSTSWPAAVSDTEARDSDEVGKEAAVKALVSSCEAAGSSMFERFSFLPSLLRVVALCLRWLKQIRSPQTKLVGSVSADEIASARLSCVRLAQAQDFSIAIRDLRAGKPVTPKSSLSPLTPFISLDGVLRVGGRLSFANLPPEERNPPILDGKNHLCLLLVRSAHLCTLHGGPLVMRSYLRNYWIIGIGRLAKSVSRRCVRCVRFRASPLSQLMGQLPIDRVREARPFSSSGVDFAGPFSVVPVHARERVPHKGYVALFVCLGTKAIHLEFVSALTSAAFIAAFQRFIARQGHCRRLYSDNGTNFRGADRAMQEMLASATNHYQEVDQSLAELGTRWSFIPPSSPHFGGLWEAGVRSVKHHLRRVVGDQVLSLKEVTTLLCNIEACLNSRPLYPLSNDAYDLAPFTPGHFLIGSPLINMPEMDRSEETHFHPTNRWHFISSLRDHFWTRWSQEYLHHLQQRSRWRQPQANLKEGDMVLIKSELSPPARWPLARVINTHPGPDGLVRVVTLRTSNGLLKRPIAKLCLLPVAEEKTANTGS